MDGAKGSALEWALALLRAPGERLVLRQRPLPREGMETLLAVAAEASPETLAEQARRFGETEANLLDAARFYAREVLFHPQADAYRVLGVEPRASAEEIKAHFRLLQLWLHPDRARSEDDVVFAARVNSAWNRLRSPERRQAYDEALRQQRPPEIFDSSGALRAVRTWVPADAPDTPLSPWRRRAPVLALGALCVVLALLAVREAEPPDDRWTEPSAVPIDAGRDPDAALVRALPDGNPGALSPRERPAPERNPPRTASHHPIGEVTTTRPPEAPPVITPVDTASLGTPPSADVASSIGSAAPAGIPADGAAPSGFDMGIAPVGRPASAEATITATAPSDSTAVRMAPPAPGPGPSFSRLQSARQAGEQLLQYLRTPSQPSPPIWGSPAVEASADLLRRQLHQAGRVRTADARWRVGGEEAVLISGFIIRGEPAGSRQLTASLRWRDGYWLVTALNMERLE